MSFSSTGIDVTDLLPCFGKRSLACVALGEWRHALTGRPLVTVTVESIEKIVFERLYFDCNGSTL